ncbi:HET-domain-containing protein, partial [Hyaloscypha variabilis F]
MLCETCLAIFAEPRKLSYGTYYPWGHSSASFAKARKEGCHLCNIVWENRSYGDPSPEFDRDFPQGCTYAFKLLNSEWARNGRGSKWLVVPDPEGDGEPDISEYLSAVEESPMTGLGHLLATEAHEIFTRPAPFWMVIDFYCPGPRIVIPLDIVKVTADNLEDMAQVNLDQQAFTGSKENLQLACTWLNNCLGKHEQCRPSFEDESWLPTRLIYVGTLGTPAIRLVSTGSLSEKVRYAALSHRWGTNKEFVLTSTLLRTYEAEICPSNLSATLRDAFHATRSIGLQYLWVDCLCIVQDDQDDWLRESATMGQVYGLSTCTIAATLGGNGDDGCFTTRNQCKVRPCKIPNPFDKTSSLRFYARSQYIGEIYRREVKQSPWYRRGWVFQERTLSPRLLIFGKTQMLWACQKLHAAETWPCGATSEDYIDRFESFEVHKSRLRTLLDKDQIISPWDTTWYIFIFSYTRSHLTRMSDRLIALQGLASQIASVTDRQYCAGLWIDKTLPLSLLWNAYRPNTQRSEEYRAPTWSWASIDGSIGFK